MFSTGNTMPERSITGSISPMPDIIIAEPWLSATDEMSRPSASDTSAKSVARKKTSHTLPLIGTPSRYRERSSIVTTFTIESARYGTAFATTM